MVIYTHTQDTQDIALRIHSVYRIGSTLKETKEDYACTGRREASEGILIDLPLIPVPDQCSLCLKICLAEDCEGPPLPLPYRGGKKVMGVNVVRISRVPFCQQIREKLLYEKRDTAAKCNSTPDM